MEDNLKELIIKVLGMHNGYLDVITEMTCLGIAGNFTKEEFKNTCQELLRENKIKLLTFTDESNKIKILMFHHSTTLLSSHGLNSPDLIRTGITDAVATNVDK